jgi:hypothetical protein
LSESIFPYEIIAASIFPGNPDCNMPASCFGKTSNIFPVGEGAAAGHSCGIGSSVVQGMAGQARLSSFAAIFPAPGSDPTPGYMLRRYWPPTSVTALVRYIISKIIAVREKFPSSGRADPPPSLVLPIG